MEEKIDSFLDLLNHLCNSENWEEVNNFFKSIYDYDTYQERLILLLFTKTSDKHMITDRENFLMQFRCEYADRPGLVEDIC